MTGSSKGKEKEASKDLDQHGIRSSQSVETSDYQREREAVGSSKVETRAKPAPYHDFDAIPDPTFAACSHSAPVTSYSSHLQASEYEYGSQWQHDLYYSQNPDTSASNSLDPSTAQMRLVKIESDVLPPQERVAIIDSRSEGISVGRDRAFGSRIRLPSMSISKDHASIFYLQESSGFAISDLGSTHGSFIISDEEMKSIGIDDENRLKLAKTISKFKRLSPSKKASKPVFLNHLDVIKFGGTLLRVHLHNQGFGWSCKDCSLRSEGGDEISLSHSISDKQLPKTQEPRSANAFNEYQEQRKFGDRKLDSEALRRVEMKDLKSTYLKRKNEDQEFSSGKSKHRYLDRAADRRSRNGNLPSVPSSGSDSNGVIRSNLHDFHLNANTSSQASDPLRSSKNKGFMMFSQMTQGVDAKIGKDLPIQIQSGGSGIGYSKLQVLGEEAEQPDKEKKREQETSRNRGESGFDYRESLRKNTRKRFDEIEEIPEL